MTISGEAGNQHVFLETFNFFDEYVSLKLRKSKLKKEWTFRFLCHYLKEQQVGDNVFLLVLATVFNSFGIHQVITCNL